MALFCRGSRKLAAQGIPCLGSFADQFPDFETINHEEEL